MENIIDINKIEMRTSFRALCLWEQVMNKPIGDMDGTMLDTAVLMWAIVVSVNGMNIDIQEWLTWIDGHEQEYKMLCDKYAAQQAAQNAISGDDKKEKDEKNKKKHVARAK